MNLGIDSEAEVRHKAKYETSTKEDTYDMREEMLGRNRGKTDRSASSRKGRTSTSKLGGRCPPGENCETCTNYIC